MEFLTHFLLVPYQTLAAPLRWLIPEWTAIYFALLKSSWALCSILFALPLSLVLLRKYRFGGIRRRKITASLLGLYSVLVLLAYSPLVGGHAALMFFSNVANYLRLDVEGKGTFYTRPNCNWLDGTWDGSVLYKRHAWLPVMHELKWSKCNLEILGKQSKSEIHVTDEHQQCDYDRKPCTEIFNIPQDGR